MGGARWGKAGGSGWEGKHTLEDLADVLRREEAAELTGLVLGGHAAQEAAEHDGEEDVRHGPCPLLVIPDHAS